MVKLFGLFKKLFARKESAEQRRQRIIREQAVAEAAKFQKRLKQLPPLEPMKKQKREPMKPARFGDKK
jgi:hypothetical protein